MSEAQRCCGLAKGWLAAPLDPQARGESAPRRGSPISGPGPPRCRGGHGPCAARRLLGAFDAHGDLVGAIRFDEFGPLPALSVQFGDIADVDPGWPTERARIRLRPCSMLIRAALESTGVAIGRAPELRKGTLVARVRELERGADQVASTARRQAEVFGPFRDGSWRWVANERRRP